MAVPTTFHAPADRSELHLVQKQRDLIIDHVYLKELFQAMPEVAAVLNSNRQIVYSNDGLLSLLPEGDRDEFLGLRMGEVLSCIHSKDNEAGCGTSESCRYCGAVNAVLESKKQNTKIVNECRIVSFLEDEEVSFDFRVTATPVVVEGEQFIMVFMQDISAEKRRIALERIFFHDIINTAGGIQGFVSFLNEVDDPNTMKEYVKVVDQLSHDLIDEIQAQRALSLAESGDLNVTASRINVRELLVEAKNTISYHAVARDKEIIIEDPGIEHIFNNDQVLAKRVIINMLKNALEATEESGKVLMGFRKNDDGGLVVYVHNDIFMPKDVQLQVFKRSFSTKGKDRGLGTYSIKLLTEKYLRGKVWFETDEKSGTTFLAAIPSI